MYSHIALGVNDMAILRAFYDATLGALGHAPGIMDESGRCYYRTATGVFLLTYPLDGETAFGGNGSRIGFSAPSPEAADAWHEAGLTHGGSPCEDPPGVREGKAGRRYLAYLRDPAGNKICALFRMT
jgi:catechol 2,3-dioxygenase-like lactoylglutathione lyase family enzyme